MKYLIIFILCTVGAFSQTLNLNELSGLDVSQPKEYYLKKYKVVHQYKTDTTESFAFNKSGAVIGIKYDKFSITYQNNKVVNITYKYNPDNKLTQVYYNWIKKYLNNCTHNDDGRAMFRFDNCLVMFFFDDGLLIIELI